jgi:hypothetical protein
VITPPSVQLLGVPLRKRWTQCDASLQSLAHGLVHELSPLHTRPWPVPTRKARLTRIGGRCPADGTPLTFDPWQPHDHACPQCDTMHRGLEHDDWWAMGAQLWCAERALHASVLGVMLGRADLLALGAQGLDALTEAWPTFPNRDNALGPTRPFFSTYLESVWLLTTSLAATVLAQVGRDQALVDRFRDRVASPSRALIASFPEGRSNRQAWHVAARLVSSMLLEDERGVIDAVHGESGLLALLADGLLRDGSWYEGENYHLFAHRGLWYGVTAVEAMDDGVPDELRARFDAGFRTPLLGLLPDGTFPSRRDSRYGVSVHQWRFAEWCELGLVRQDDPVVRAWLHRLYASPHPRRDTGRARATGDIERDEPPCALSRAELGWRTLLFARPDAWPAPSHLALESVLLPAQGLSVLRRDEGRLYVALEGGHTAGGHGHPDRLALTLQDGAHRVLEDPGTGSYVERALHWYRSTLAHNAPLVDGRSQRRVPTHVTAFDSLTDGAWVRAEAEGIAPGVWARRTIVLVDEHVVDTLEWRADRVVTLELPVHLDAELDGPRDWSAADPGGAGGLEDGFDFLRDVQHARWQAHAPAELRAADGSDTRAWVVLQLDGAVEGDTVTWWRAIAPGPPRRPPRRVHWVRVRAASGHIRAVWSLRGAVRSVAFGETAQGVLSLDRADGSRVEHTPMPDAWQVDVFAGAERRSFRLATGQGTPRAPADEAPHEHAPEIGRARTPFVLREDELLQVELGAEHYRRSEQTWEEAGAPSASVRLTRHPDGLQLSVHARTGEVVVPSADAENPLDNERADVNADGVQLYLGRVGASDWSAAWLLVPVPGSREVRVTPLVPGAEAPVAQWAAVHDGWSIEVLLPDTLLASVRDAQGTIGFDLLVSERPADRVRRRGQLVLSGAAGEFVYLRGDRHDPARALLLRLPLDASEPNPSASPA